MRPVLLVAALALLSVSASARAPRVDRPVRVTGGLVQGVAGRDPAVTVFKLSLIHI